MTKKYHVTYAVKHEPEGLLAEQIPPSVGATDAVIVVSIMRSENSGASSTLFLGLDGATGDELAPIEYFKVWMLLAAQLAKDLPPGALRDLCASTFNKVREVLL